jgi:hypothetical protein
LVLDVDEHDDRPIWLGETLDRIAGLVRALSHTEKRVSADREQPTPGVAAALECVPRPIGPHVRVLDQILGIGAVAGERQREAIDIVEPRQRLLLEPNVGFAHADTYRGELPKNNYT